MAPLRPVLSSSPPSSSSGAGAVRSPLPRVLLSPWTWVVVAAVVRLVLLVGLTRGADQAMSAVKERGVQTHVGAVQYIDRRTDLHPLTEDESSYDEMAQNLVRGRGFVLDSIWLITTPGQPAMYAGCTYPLFVAGVYRVFGSGHEIPVYLLQIVLHALAAIFVWRAGTSVGGRLAGTLGAAFYAVHPTLAWCAVAMMSEGVVVPLVALLGWALVDRGALVWGERRWTRPVAIGVVAALLCLARSTCTGLVWISALVLLWQARRALPRLRRLARPAAMLVVFALVVLPWTARNYAHWHRFIPFSTKSGTAAWMHNHPGLVVEFSKRAFEGPQPVDIFSPEIQNLPDEATRDARLMSMFQDFARREPMHFAGLAGVRFVFALLPVSTTFETTAARAGAWYAKGIPLFLFAAAALCARRRLLLRVAPWGLAIAYWQGIQTLAGSGLRYRAPIDPIVACAVGVAAAVVLAAISPKVARAFPLAARWLRAPEKTADVAAGAA